MNDQFSSIFFESFFQRPNNCISIKLENLKSTNKVLKVCRNERYTDFIAFIPLFSRQFIQFSSIARMFVAYWTKFAMKSGINAWHSTWINQIMCTTVHSMEGTARSKVRSCENKVLWIENKNSVLSELWMRIDVFSSLSQSVCKLFGFPPSNDETR